MCIRLRNRQTCTSNNHKLNHKYFHLIFNSGFCQCFIVDFASATSSSLYKCNRVQEVGKHESIPNDTTHLPHLTLPLLIKITLSCKYQSQAPHHGSRTTKDSPKPQVIYISWRAASPENSSMSLIKGCGVSYSRVWYSIV